ncbi:F-box protein [Acorus calamus]|uniref:F-box protein n=1 Tax=Acorus calamus TaxID=4465 RepID=A0AAV9EBL0_ACOCL|nr:F-box protein [Acorus calamus]
MADNKSQIPYDILIDILSRLPGKSLARSRSACKHWHDIIDHDPNFLTLRRARHPPFTVASLSQTYGIRLYAFDDKKNAFTKTDDNFACNAIQSTHTVLPSCGGLICCYGEHHVLVLNPSTSDRHLLPSSTTTIIGCGFGYSPSLNRHKTVRFVEHPWGILCEVFTLGTDSWRPIEEPSEQLIIFNHHQPVCVDGKIYWIGINRRGRLPRIVGFDLETERFTAVDGPMWLSRLGVNVDHLDLRVLEARLCVVKRMPSDVREVKAEGRQRVEVWVMVSEGIWRERYAFGLKGMYQQTPEIVWGMKAVVREGRRFYLCEASRWGVAEGCLGRVGVGGFGELVMGLEGILNAGDDKVGFNVVKLLEFEDGGGDGDSDGVVEYVVIEEESLSPLRRHGMVFE